MLRFQPFSHLSATSPQLFSFQDCMLPQYLRKYSGVVSPPLLSLHLVHITAQQDGSLLSQFVAVRPCFQFTQRSLEDSTYICSLFSAPLEWRSVALAAGDDALAECSGPWCSEALTPSVPSVPGSTVTLSCWCLPRLSSLPLLFQHVGSCSPLAASPLPSLTAPITVTRPELYSHILSATTDIHPNAA